MARSTFTIDLFFQTTSSRVVVLEAAGTAVTVYTDSAGTTATTDLLAVGGGAITPTVPAAGAPLQFQGPDGVTTLYVKAGSGPLNRLAADSTGGGGAHPDLAAHDGLGLATQAELDTHATTEANARTAAITAAVNALVNSAPGTLDTLAEIAAALTADESAASALVTTVAGKLAKASNLADLTDPAAGRTNLGLGSAATQAATAFDAAGAAASAVAAEVTARNTAITAAINSLINSAPGALDTLGELAAALAADESAAAALTAAVAAKAADAAVVHLAGTETVTGAKNFTGGLSKSGASVLTAAYPGATLLVAASDSAVRTRNAADYVCTGTDDDLVINTALAALPTVGGVVLLAEGTYVLGNAGVQVLANNRHLWGTGWRDDCRLTVGSGKTPPQMIVVGTAGTGNLSGNTAKHLALDGTGTTTTDGLIASSNMFRVEDVYLSNLRDGVSLLSRTTPAEFAESSVINVRGYNISRDGLVTTSDIYDLVAHNVRFGNPFNILGRYGFNLSGPYAGLLGCRANDFYDGWGVKLTNSVQTRIVGGHFDENGANAATAGNGAGGNGGGGILADSGSRCNITGGSFNSNDSYDIYFSSTANSVISGNVCQGQGAKGPKTASIYVTGVNGVTIGDNSLTDMVTRGIVVASSNHVTVHDNVITYPSRSPTQASLRVFASTYVNTHHNILGNGFTEESTSNNNVFQQNDILAGSSSTVGASTIVVAFGSSQQPSYPWQAENLLGWSFDRAGSSSGGVAPSIGNTMVFVKVMVPTTITVTNIVMNVITAGATLTAGTVNVASLYDQSGTLLSSTADQATAWTSTGEKTMALAAAQTVTGGSGRYCWVGFMATGTTLPAFERGNGPSVAARFSRKTTTDTAPPASASPPYATATNLFWVGLS